MKLKHFITWLYEQDLKGNINEDTELLFFADYGDAGYNKVKEAEIDEDGNIVVSAHN
nr:MAG TPA: hypothetical protein [Caudoviricetes sp.]